MLARIAEDFFSVCRNQLPSLYISFILFGQVFFSLLSNTLGIENRISMLAFRSLLMLLSFGFVLLNLRRERLFISIIHGLFQYFCFG